MAHACSPSAPSTPDDQLYALLQKHAAILRYPEALMRAKVATVGALASLQPEWVASWAQFSATGLLRAITAGWACIYRLAYLLATGQAGSTSLVGALRSPHAVFERAYPSYPEWLER